MHYRKATPADSSVIIELLKSTLGEERIPKSIALWNWKHMQNPFGESPVILAEQDGKLVAVRAFLRWEFVQEGKIIQACRAVDTAVHPDFQGQGLFTKLTLELINEIHELGIDLIYNTPNKQSMRGYLKMGWKKWGKLPLKIAYNFPLPKNRTTPSLSNWEAIQDFIKLLGNSKTSNLAQTHLVPSYINWRYKNCPLFPYYFLTDQRNFLLIYRIKEGKMGRELRITDLFTLNALDSSAKNELHGLLQEAQKQHAVNFTSFSGLAYQAQDALNLGLIPTLNIGPIVTLRAIHSELNPQDIHWNWSLGDLEVF